MTLLLELSDMREGYVTLVDTIAHLGKEVSPRGQAVLEVTDVTFTVADLTNALPIGVGRDLNLLIAALEALQLVGATSCPELLVAASPQFANYQEGDGRFYGAYGERVGFQTESVVEKLRRDRDTRQAVITLWDPRLDNVPGFRDYPCTVALGFRVRRDRLDLSVLMRSNDVWLGTAYDVFQFTQLQWTVARQLGVEPGRYTHTAWSLHIYERDLPRVAKLHAPQGELPRLPRGLGDDAERVAVELLADPASFGQTEDPDISWYQEQVLRALARVSSER